MIRTYFSTLFFALAVFALAACGSDQDSEAPGTQGTQASADADTEVVLQPRGNEMQFEQTEFSVEAGQTVRLVFENTATSPSMAHNVVILTDDDDATAERIGEAGLQAGQPNDYVPQDDEAVLAYTPVAQPGETVEITFTAPSEPGTYRYICTFPGHWATMQGTMTVTNGAA